MSKRLITCLLAASLSLVFFGCDEENNTSTRPQKTQEGDACTVSKCQNASTLLKCVDGAVVKESCGDGYKCANGECVVKPLPTVKCEVGTKPTCSADGSYALSCVDGIQQNEPCSFGCENGACIKACSFTDRRCNNDGTAVTECKDGEIVEVETCPCNMGKCKEKCNTPGSSTCKGNISVYCGDDGIATETECPNGCDASTGSCEERCEAGCSKDGKSLIECDGGKLGTTTPCEYGCKNNKCLTEEESGNNDVVTPGGNDGTETGGNPGSPITISCDSDPLRCTLSGAGDVIDCTGDTPKIIHCPYGCSKGACLDASSAPSCTGTSDFCDTFGEVLYHCVDGKQQQESCEYGCSNGKCNDAEHAINCTEGAAACAPGGSLLQICKNNEIVFEPCLYGCENDKCTEKTVEQEACKTDACTYIPSPGVRRCVDGFYQDQSCDGICVYDAYGKGLVDCVPSDYCTEDAGCKHLGKTTCDLENFKCI